MATDDKFDKIGRVNLIYPDRFGSQYNGVSGDALYNLSVPTEDLSIAVELVTTDRNRTILSTQNNNQTTQINVNPNDKNKIKIVNFIGGSSNNQTANKWDLTTSYTELSSGNDTIDEALGITNIDITFDTSYTPLVNITFIDIRGGALFQNGAQSKFAVLFKLPYPIFQLKVKGFYGKPVTYCLHMLKCNSKFNSQTGNFEINAEFVGYTFAFFSDMIIGYLKAVEETQMGKDMLDKINADLTKAKEPVPPILSINEYIKRVSQINSEIKKVTNEDNNPDVKTLNGIPQLKTNLNQILGSITETINGFKNINGLGVQNTNPLSTFIVAQTGINPIGGTSTDTVESINSLNNLITTFDTNVNNYIKEYNNNVLNYNLEPKQFNLDPTLSVDTTTISLNDLKSSSYNQTLINQIGNDYGIDTSQTNDINFIINRLKEASKTFINNGGGAVYYDFYDLQDEVNNLINQLDIKYNIILPNVTQFITNNVQKKLGMPTDIRSIFKIFTTAAEIFLECLVSVSKSCFDNKKDERKTEFNRLNLVKNFDIKPGDSNVYAWPEYVVNNVETYLGSTELDHNKIPELKFVDDLYQGMITSGQIAKDASSLTNDYKPLWNAVNPIDCSLDYVGYNSGLLEKNPYGRLPANSGPNDVARLALLRGIAFMGFSNSYLSTEEITAFAKSENALIMDKFSKSDNILRGVGQNYTTYDKYVDIRGVVGSVDTKIINFDGSQYVYTYLVNDVGQSIIPIKPKLPTNTSDIFNNITFDKSLTDSVLLDNNYYIVENNNKTFGQILNTPLLNNYISIIDKTTYNIGNNTSSKAILFEKISTDFENLKNINFQTFIDAGFLANSGKYGVQDFTLIDYGSSYGQDNGNTSPFYSLFYDSNTLFTTALAENKNYTTSWDLTNDNNKNYFSVLPNKDDFLSKDFIYDVFTSLGRNSKNKKNVGKNIELLLNYNKTKDNTNINYPFINFGYYDSSYGNEAPLSLFGSRFYFSQDKIEAKALLFLHCLPWRGLTNTNGDIAGIFSSPQIKNIFKYRTGFIQVPKLFAAFIGGLLFRNSQETDIINYIGYDESNDSLFNNKFFDYPNKPNLNQYIKSADSKAKNKPHSMSFGKTYVGIEFELLNLPQSAKDVFILEFKNFIINDFNEIRQLFEINPIDVNGNILTGDENWVLKYQELLLQSTVKIQNKPDTNLSAQINLTDITYNLKLNNQLSFTNVFDLFTFVCNFEENNIITSQIGTFNANYYIRYKDGLMNDQSNKLKQLFFDYKYISNNSHLMWQFVIKNSGESDYQNNTDITIAEKDFQTYFNAINPKPETSTQNQQNTKPNIGDKAVENIKFETYRNLKKIYEKWVSDLNNGSDSVVFQCCTKSPTIFQPDKLNTTDEIKKKTHTNLYSPKNPKLIDTFRFIDRSFKDIGDEFNINPFAINKLLLDNTNISLYNFFGRILTDNHFNFIPLSNFIDYNDPKELNEVFQPIPYYKIADITSTGPAFVCMYIGQYSTKLDLVNNNNYNHPNDGFDFTTKLRPSDFNTTGQPYEDVGAAFVVKYGQQNQNIFKDIILDQHEFGETIESLQITDNIANGNLNSTFNYVGQNLFNVYSTRSYKVEVEMMGNAMIQPMMYFQLDNIPMFHGAYLITKVRHNIKPNYMSTTFTGSRVKASKLPIIDAATVYGDILASYGINAKYVATGGFGNYVDEYFAILNANLPVDENNKPILYITGVTSTNSNTFIENVNKSFSNDWGSGTIDGNLNQNIIDNFFKSKKIGTRDSYKSWDAAYISYFITDLDSNFPVNGVGYGYATAAMNGVSSYEIFPLKSGLTIKAELGDVLIYSISGDFSTSHSDFICDITNNVATLIGGDLTSMSPNGNSIQTVKKTSITLDNGNFTNNTSFPTNTNYKLLIKKTNNNNYYNGVNLSSFPVDINQIVYPIPTKNETFKSFVTYYTPNGGYTNAQRKIEGGLLDKNENPVFTLDDYLNKKPNVDFVTVAMDGRFKYGTKLINPSYKDSKGNYIPFRVNDTGDAFINKGGTKIDIPTNNYLAAQGKVSNITIAGATFPIGGNVDGWTII